MGYREIPEDRVLEFPATPGFKEWEPFFTEESTTHPAKMNLNLLKWILETYTEPGEVVLDPMAGTGSTIILAALLGRHGVAVELEPRFCDMIRTNIKRAERQATLISKGRMICIQGDSRELSKLLSEADAIVTSPPYSECEHDYRHGLKVLGNNFKGRRAWEDRERAELSEQNIGRLPHGDIDAIVTSPPYSESMSKRRKGYTTDPQLSRTRHMGEDSSDENIGNLPHGDINAIVTSPPYEAGPFDRAGGHGGAYAGGIAERDEKMRPEKISDENIGSLKADNYLGAMLQVYRECWKVLKVQGKLIIVVKNFIRDKAVVRLDLDTIRLCEAAGFRFVDRWYFKLPTRSFWKILYHKKHPEVPEVEFEDVLAFKKGDKG